MQRKNYIEFLGTGTSVGVPMIGCNCKVCRSDDSKDQRLRSSVHIRYNDVALQVDVGPDFRYQMLRAGVEDIDAVLITHEHKDHVGGLDDLRPFMFKYKKPFPIYLTDQVLREIKACYAYAFAEHQYPGAPRFETHAILPGKPFNINGVEIMPIPVFHGNLSMVGYRIANVAYLTDVNKIPPSSMTLLENLDILVLSALRHEPHHSHFSVSEAIDVVNQLQPKKTYFTHISHQFGKISEQQMLLPDEIEIAYDGLKVYF